MVATDHKSVRWLYIIILPILKIVQINGHGRLIEPPSRASMWRYGFNTPPNYNDHELYCGGFTRQWQTNGGKCGICGDAWDLPQPRPHEAGGKYGQGIIVRKYKMGSMFTIRVELTANHRGYFEFKLCPNNAIKKVATQQCLDKYVLKRAKYTVKDPDEVYHETRFYPGTENKVYEMKYMLPAGLSCTQCVLQWKYVAGNNWGMCSNGTGAVGCGPQEEFRSCADISIHDSNGSSDEPPHGDGTTRKTAIATSPATVSSTETILTDSSPTDVNRSTTTEQTSTADVRENEIPDNEDDVLEQLSKKSEQKRVQEYVLFMFSISLLSLLLVFSLFFLLYFYYYYAGDRIQKWRSNVGRISDNFKTFTCWSNLKNKLLNNSNRAEQRKQQLPDECEKCPVPPPRTKRQSIGFKGVPENLV